MYEIVNIPDDAPDLQEQLGTKMKFWFKGDGGSNILFKEGRPNTGENWSEKVAAELCEQLGIPHARYDLAIWKEKEGVITPSFVPPDGTLVHGNQLLSRAFSDYDERKLYQQRQHTLRVVLAIIGNKPLRPPIGSTGFNGVQSALDYFIGYLMLDALVANQDRHHENWALIWTKEKKLFLAPTYDHAAGLGRNETDRKRQGRLEATDVIRGMVGYVQKARSGFFLMPSAPKAMLTIDAFSEGAKHAPNAARGWLERLKELSPKNIENIFAQIPEELITPLAARFAIKLILLNKHRLLDIERSLT